MQRKFVEEIEIDGDLFHVLDCGHAHVARNNPETAEPEPEQGCTRCVREAAAATSQPN